LGRRATIDKNRIDRGFEVAEDIAVTFQKVVEQENTLCTFFDMNFEGREFEDAWATLDMRRASYQQQFDQIRTLSTTRGELNEKLKPGRVYLRKSVIDDIQKYIDLSLFRYDTDGGIMVDTFDQEFLRNLVSEENRATRERLYRKIERNLSKLIR
jgi:hypothetical protein